LLSKPSLKKRRYWIKPLKWVKEDEVWKHWRAVDQIPDEIVNWKTEVRGKLPNIVAWFRSKIEKDDLDKIYIISSDDWKVLVQSFKLVDAVKSLEENQQTSLGESILETKKAYEKNLNGLDRVLVFVAPTIRGNYTIIDGNKRAVALLSLKKLIGLQVYLGISPKIRDYYWAKYTPV
jgi:hypothetical protein